jgi:ferredoxin-NADP reductase
MVNPNHRVTTIVREIRRESDRVFAYVLADPDDWDLPPFTPGAHIDVHLPNGMVRQYSLYSSPRERTRYRIAVQREKGGRGGSAYFQDAVREGDVLLVSLPRNHFPLAAQARKHLLIAGGIGITPIVSMVEELRRRSEPYELHFCARAPNEMPFRSWAAPLVEQGAATLYFTRGEPRRRLELEALVKGAAPGTHIYCCGPERMIRAVAAAAEGRSPETMHYEHFGAPTVAVSSGAFQVELARSKRIVPVPAGTTILAALREAGVELDASCEGGVCLTCKTRYLGGIPIHRDLVMKPAERREFMTPCVSGCASEKLVLDL